MSGINFQFNIDDYKSIVRDNPLEIRKFSYLQNNIEMARFAVEANGLARFFLAPSLRQDPEIAALAEAHLPKQFVPPQQAAKRGFLIGGELYQYLVSKGIGGFSLIPVKKERETEENDIEGEISEYLRDSQVTLLSGEWLIPYNMKGIEYEKLLVAMGMRVKDHFCKDEENFDLTGEGFLEKNTDAAMIRAIDLGIPFKRAKTCIEGGNCFLFQHNGQKKAIVGELSLYLSFLALSQQNYFDQVELQLPVEPCDDAIRIARNLFYCERREVIGNAFEVGLIAPLTDPQRFAFREKARQIDAMLEVTKKCITEELDVSFSHLAIIHQEYFHIDLGISVTPDGDVLLDDYSLTEKFLSHIGQDNLTPEESQLFTEYCEENRKRKPLFDIIHQETIQRLTQIGLNVVLLPLSLSAPKHGWTLNYCNGIFANNPLSYERPIKFITTGPTDEREKRFHQRIVANFQCVFPKVELVAIPHMSATIADNNGGIHCATAEVNYPPLD